MLDECHEVIGLDMLHIAYITYSFKIVMFATDKDNIRNRPVDY